MSNNEVRRNRIVRDSYRLDIIGPLLRLRLTAVVETKSGQEDYRKQIWFDITSIQLLANTLQRFLRMPDDAVLFASCGDDRLELFYGGPEDSDAFVHLFNRRRKRAEYPGYKHCPLSRSAAKELVEELLNMQVAEAVPQPVTG